MLWWGKYTWLKPWLQASILSTDFDAKESRYLKVCRHVLGPCGDGSVVKLVSDGVVSIYAIFTAQSVAEIAQSSDESETPPSWNNASIIVRDYIISHSCNNDLDKCEYQLVVQDFSLYSRDGMFRLKTEPPNVMSDVNIKRVSRTEWEKFMRSKTSTNFVEQDSVSLSQLLAEMDQESIPNAAMSLTFTGSSLAHTEDDNRQQSHTAAIIRKNPDIATTSSRKSQTATPQLDNSGSAKSQPDSASVTSLPCELSAEFTADSFLISSWQQLQLEALTDWRENSQASMDTPASHQYTLHSQSQKSSPRKAEVISQMPNGNQQHKKRMSDAAMQVSTSLLNQDKVTDKPHQTGVAVQVGDSLLATQSGSEVVILTDNDGSKIARNDATLEKEASDCRNNNSCEKSRSVSTPASASKKTSRTQPFMAMCEAMLNAIKGTPKSTEKSAGENSAEKPIEKRKSMTLETFVEKRRHEAEMSIDTLNDNSPVVTYIQGAKTSAGDNVQSTQVSHGDENSGAVPDFPVSPLTPPLPTPLSGRAANLSPIIQFSLDSPSVIGESPSSRNMQHVSDKIDGVTQKLVTNDILTSREEREEEKRLEKQRVVSDDILSSSSPRQDIASPRRRSKQPSERDEGELSHIQTPIGDVRSKQKARRSSTRKPWKHSDAEPSCNMSSQHLLIDEEEYLRLQQLAASPYSSPTDQDKSDADIRNVKKRKTPSQRNDDTESTDSSPTKFKRRHTPSRHVRKSMSKDIGRVDASLEGLSPHQSNLKDSRKSPRRSTPSAPRHKSDSGPTKFIRPRDTPSKCVHIGESSDSSPIKCVRSQNNPSICVHENSDSSPVRPVRHPVRDSRTTAGSKSNITNTDCVANSPPPQLSCSVRSEVAGRRIKRRTVIKEIKYAESSSSEDEPSMKLKGRDYKNTRDDMYQPDGITSSDSEAFITPDKAASRKSRRKHGQPCVVITDNGSPASGTITSSNKTRGKPPKITLNSDDPITPGKAALRPERTGKLMSDSDDFTPGRPPLSTQSKRVRLRKVTKKQPPQDDDYLPSPIQINSTTEESTSCDDKTNNKKPRSAAKTKGSRSTVTRRKRSNRKQDDSAFAFDVKECRISTSASKKQDVSVLIAAPSPGRGGMRGRGRSKHKLFSESTSLMLDAVITEENEPVADERSSKKAVKKTKPSARGSVVPPALREPVCPINHKVSNVTNAEYDATDCLQKGKADAVDVHSDVFEMDHAPTKEQHENSIEKRQSITTSPDVHKGDTDHVIETSPKFMTQISQTSTHGARLFAPQLDATGAFTVSSQYGSEENNNMDVIHEPSAKTSDPKLLRRNNVCLKDNTGKEGHFTSPLHDPLLSGNTSIGFTSRRGVETPENSLPCYQVPRRRSVDISIPSVASPTEVVISPAGTAPQQTTRLTQHSNTQVNVEFLLEALKLHRLSKRQRQGHLSLLKVKIPDELLTLATYFKVTENDITQR